MNVQFYYQYSFMEQSNLQSPLQKQQNQLKKSLDDSPSTDSSINQNPLEKDENSSTIDDQLSQQSFVSCKSQSLQIATVKSKNDEIKVDQIKKSFNTTLSIFANKSERQEEEFQKTLTDIRSQNSQTVQILKLYNQNQKNDMQNFDIEKYTETAMGLVLFGSNMLNKAMVDHETTKVKTSELFEKQMMNNCKAVETFINTWQKMQDKIRNNHEKDLELQQKAFYKKMKAAQIQRETKIQLLEKQSIQLQKDKQRQIAILEKERLTNLKLVHKQIRDEQQREKQQNRIQQEHKQKEDLMIANNKKMEQDLQRQKKQNELDAEARKNKIQQDSQKAKLQIELKRKESNFKEQLIRKAFDDAMANYKLEMIDAQKFIENQRRNGKGYTWGSTPPSIEFVNGENRVKLGTVWYSGK